MILKQRGHDAIAIGVSHASHPTINLLSNWADRILLAERSLQEYIDEPYRGKIEESFEIGPDEWGDPLNRELWSLIYERLPIYPNDDTSGDLV